MPQSSAPRFGSPDLRLPDELGDVMPVAEVVEQLHGIHEGTTR